MISKINQPQRYKFSFKWLNNPFIFIGHYAQNEAHADAADQADKIIKQIAPADDADDAD